MLSSLIMCRGAQKTFRPLLSHVACLRKGFAECQARCWLGRAAGYKSGPEPVGRICVSVIRQLGGRGESEHAGGDFRPAEVGHRQMAEGDREGRNSKAVAAPDYRVQIKEIVSNERDVDRPEAMEYWPCRLWRSGAHSRRRFAQAGRKSPRL